MAHGIPLDHVVARNLRELIEEHGLRHVELATRMSVIGFGWTSNTVAQAVTLRRSLSLTELAGLCDVFGIGLDRLLAGDDMIATPAANAHGEAVISLSAIRDRLLAGKGLRFRDTPEQQIVSIEIPDELWDDTARRLEVDVPTVKILAKRLYGDAHLNEERDRRTGDLSGLSFQSARAKRGHVMRKMLAEMRAEIPKLEKENAD